MSEARFTKGDWVVLPFEDDKEYIRIRGSALGGRYKIANVIDLKDHHNGSEWCKRERAESMANAQLIKKAPDLYEAVEMASILMGKLNKNTKSGNEFSELKSHFDRLLAEARGEQ